MTASESDIWLWEEARRCAEEWFRMQCQDLWARIHVYYRRGELAVFRDGQTVPEGYTLGIQERIPVSQEVSHCMHWIYNRARRLPCLPVEELAMK